jgi:hypothetical protein
MTIIDHPQTAREILNLEKIIRDVRNVKEENVQIPIHIAEILVDNKKAALEYDLAKEIYTYCEPGDPKEFGKVVARAKGMMAQILAGEMAKDLKLSPPARPSAHR